MSYLGKMYSRKNFTPTVSEKNPNRVLGGLRAQNVDTFTLLGEDGQEKQIPTKAYVLGIEQKLRQLEAISRDHDKKIARLNNDQKQDRIYFNRSQSN